MANIDAKIVKCMIYRFEFPYSKKLNYQKVIRAAEPQSNVHLSAASAARDEMVLLLEKGEPTQALIYAIENYLPHLFGLVVAVEGQPHIRLNDPLSFSWTSALSKNRKTHFVDYTYRYEVVMTLMAYGYIHCNRAWAINESSTEANFEENSKQIANHLRTAAGIFDYVHNVELPRWINLPADRALETMPAVTSSLSLICIAAAQDLTVKKAAMKGTSKATVVKLCADVWRKYQAALSQVQSLPKEMKKGASPSFKDFLKACTAIQQANTYKYSGNVSHESGKCGVAVAYLNVAVKAVKDVSGGGSLAPWKSMIDEQKAEVEHVQRLYSKENDMITFESVPQEAMLDVPEPKTLMVPILYNPPPPAFTQIH